MICLGIFDTDPVRKDTLKQWLVRYTVQRNCELELLWFTEQDPSEKIAKYAPRLQIALIGLDAEAGQGIGARLYSQNPECRILYYRSTPCDLEPLLCSRPVSFYLWEKGREAFLDKLDGVYMDVVMTSTTFRYETKSSMYLLPKGNILYFQSDLRYVNICLRSGESPRLPAKLSQIEALAGAPFVRIHKSYLVNARHVLWMNRKNHTVVLSNGQQLPVSDAQYDSACQAFRAMK